MAALAVENVRASLGGLAARAARLGLVCAAVMLGGCDDKTSSNIMPVTVAGKKFFLEIAADHDTRFLGLGKRDHIEEDGGMIFVFPFAQKQEFVMRDCRVPIDILYLDGGGRVLTIHTMQPEEPRRADEPPPVNPDDRDPYNDRLKRYSSRYPSQIVVEIKGGKAAELGVKEGERLVFDTDRLKKMAR